jgi:hypothetical protein
MDGVWKLITLFPPLEVRLYLDDAKVVEPTMTLISSLEVASRFSIFTVTVVPSAVSDSALVGNRLTIVGLRRAMYAYVKVADLLMMFSAAPEILVVVTLQSVDPAEPWGTRIRIKAVGGSVRIFMATQSGGAQVCVVDPNVTDIS